MQCKVLVHRLPYGCKYYEHGDIIEMPDDPSTNVLIKLGRVKVANETAPKKKRASKKYKTKVETAE